MHLTTEELSDLYRRRTGRAGAGDRECPSTDVLRNAVEGKLGPSERTSLVSHLRRCSDCAREYRVVRALEPWHSELCGAAPAHSHAVSGFVWKLRERLEGWTWAPAVALAALAALMVLGAWMALLVRENDGTLVRLAAEISKLRQDAARSRATAAVPPEALSETELAALRRDAAEAARPQLNVPIVDLDPGGITRGVPAGEITEIRVPSSSSVFALILHVAGERTFPEYELEIRDGRGRQVWTGQSLRPTPENLFTVVLSKLRFPQGGYRLHLYGSSRGSRVLVESYALRVRSD